MTEAFASRHYAERAQDYVTSTVHSEGRDLDAIETLVAGKNLRRVLDLGCGGGHVSYRLAPHVGEVVACDITESMLNAVQDEAGRRNYTNITTAHMPAERLDFENASFDAVFCRFTTHHWNDATAGLREARRVLAPTGFGMFIDVTAPASPLVDSWLQTLELLRDISHVRDYSIAEWTSLLGDAGFAVTATTTHALRMEFASWVARTRTPAERVAAIRSLQNAAPESAIRQLQIEPDGSFTLNVSSFLVTGQ